MFRKEKFKLIKENLMQMELNLEIKGEQEVIKVACGQISLFE